MSTPEIQGYLLALRNQEEQKLEDIRLGLLATLDEYRGFSKIKKLFEEAIKGVALNSIYGSGRVEIGENVGIGQN